MQEEDRNEVLSLLMNSFFQKESSAKCLQLNDPLDFAKNLINDTLYDRCSFVVDDLQTNKLVGVCLNEIKYHDDKSIINKSNGKLNFILQFLNEMH